MSYDRFYLQLKPTSGGSVEMRQHSAHELTSGPYGRNSDNTMCCGWKAGLARLMYTKLLVYAVFALKPLNQIFIELKG